MQILSQKDKAWSLKKIGASTLLIRDYGCTTTALAELNNRFGANCNPADVASHTEWYTPAGLVLWDKLDLKYASFVPNGRIYGFNKAQIIAALMLPNENGVLLEVAIPGALKHWLFGEGFGTDGTIYARDPINGSIVDIVKKYGKITGSAHFVPKKA